MKTVTIYPVIGIDVHVPDDYEGVLENDIDLMADFTPTKFHKKGCELGVVWFCCWSDGDYVDSVINNSI